MNQNAIVTQSSWQEMKEQAAVLLKSGFLPTSIKTAENALAIMMLGQELGIGAWAALNGINVIQNKTTVSPQLMLALINRSGQLEDIRIESDDAQCTVTMKRKGRTPHTETFDLANAAAMQLSGKDNYKKQPATMMKWRAVAACARVVFADVILGLYTPEEMGADVIADDQGNMTVIAVKPEPAPPKVSLPALIPAGSTGASSDPDPLDWTNEPQEAPASNGNGAEEHTRTGKFRNVKNLSDVWRKSNVDPRAHFDSLIKKLLNETRTIDDDSTDADILNAITDWYANQALREAK